MELRLQPSAAYNATVSSLLNFTKQQLIYLRQKSLNRCKVNPSSNMSSFIRGRGASTETTAEKSHLTADFKKPFSRLIISPLDYFKLHLTCCYLDD